MPDHGISEELVEHYFRTVLQFQRFFLDEQKRPPDEESVHSSGDGRCHGLHSRLKHSEKMLLFVIQSVMEEHPCGVSVSDLSRLLHVKPPSITTPLNHLEEKKLVVRIQDSNDRRIVRVQITEKGCTLFDQMKTVFFERTRGLLEYLGEKKAKEYLLLTEEVLQYVKSKHEKHSQT